eukprot:scaffold198868_cov32-Tisochrysis_lutea.AAC.4
MSSSPVAAALAPSTRTHHRVEDVPGRASLPALTRERECAMLAESVLSPVKLHSAVTTARLWRTNTCKCEARAEVGAPFAASSA